MGWCGERQGDGYENSKAYCCPEDMHCAEARPEALRYDVKHRRMVGLYTFRGFDGQYGTTCRLEQVSLVQTCVRQAPSMLQVAAVMYQVGNCTKSGRPVNLIVAVVPSCQTRQIRHDGKPHDLDVDKP